MVISRSSMALCFPSWNDFLSSLVITGFRVALFALGIAIAQSGLAGEPATDAPVRSLFLLRPFALADLNLDSRTDVETSAAVSPNDVSWFDLPRSPRYLLVDEAVASEPDITKPGPDMGDYPNSAFTLPKGRAYVEMAPFTIATADAENPASYNWPFMLRFGLTDDVELRLIGSGLTSVYSQPDTIVGFSPLILDAKVHLWDDQMSRLIPAASLEVYIQTNWGSPDFQGGVQSSLNLNLDFPVTKKTNIEMTFGYTGVQDAVRVLTGARFIPRFNHLVPTVHKENLNVNQFSYQWAIEHQLTERFQVFVHGYYNGPILLQSGPGTVIGIGYFYQMTKRSTVFNSYNAAVDETAAPFSSQLGIAFAF